MGETLAETRVEVDAQRASVEKTADELQARVRHALDIKARFKENPLLFVGLGAGAAFLIAGGPVRVARMLRRRVSPSSTEKAYDALPRSMRAWVDSLVDGVGPRAEQAREALAGELHKWRQEPLKNKKARKELAKAMVEGPPGPSRTAWKAAEAGMTLLSAALARRAIESFITGDKPAAGSRLKPPPSSPGEAAREYSGISDRRR